MRWRYALYVVGILVFFFGLTMLAPLVCALAYQDASIGALIYSLLITCAAGGGLILIFKGSRASSMTQREGMAIVAVGWTAVGFFGGLPFLLVDDWTVVDALFESVSGFTTTGASIVSDIEALPRGILLWRSFIQWLGGMGIIVLSIAILPFLGVGGMQLYKAEVPSPVPDKLKPRIRDTAVILWKVYLLFTIAEAAILMAGGMPFFDALCHALTTLPTGGFSTQNASVAQFESVYFECVIMVFMVLAGINFSLHYQLMRGKPLAFWRDPECRFFLGAIAVLSAIVTWDCFGDVYASVAESLRYGTFQIISIITTTGFATADYGQWPALSQMVIFVCMFVGGSAGSTGGGMKCLRIMLCFKFCYNELFAMVHPHAVSTVKIGGKTVPDDIMRSVLGFLALYMGLFGVTAVLLAATGVDFVTSIGAVAACIGNIGPGFGQVGPVGNFAAIPAMGKWLLIWCMLLGRLEIYTLIILLVPEFYRR